MSTEPAVIQPVVSSDSPIFILGCPRSGTSLLRNLLRAHPHLTFPGESHFIPTFYRWYGDPRNAAEACRLSSRILRNYWVQLWRMSLKASDFADCRSFREAVCRLFEAWARRENKPRWGDKTPHYVTEIPVLLELFPEAKIIHIYRDGRDVALSWLRVRMEPRNLYVAARLWKTWVSAGRRDGAKLPCHSYMEVPYEGLIERPRETMQSVCAFIEEPFDEAVLRPNLIAGEREHHQRRGWNRPSWSSDIEASNAGKWRTRMSASARVLFESVAGDLLEELGYQTEGRRRTITWPERAMWRLHHQFWWTLPRLRPRFFRARFPAFLRAWLVRLRSNAR